MNLVFITLTQVGRDDPVVVSVDHIIAIYPSGMGSAIALTSGAIAVRETQDEVIKLISSAIDRTN